MKMAVAKQATTIATQATLAARDFAVEICTRPWIVELPRKSWTTLDDAIMNKYRLCTSSDGTLYEEKKAYLVHDYFPTELSASIYNEIQ